MADTTFEENLAAGTGAGFGIREAIGLWADEVCGCLAYPKFDHYIDVALTLQASYNPNDPQASHFTQVVWKSTTQLGCASAICNGIFPANFGVRRSDYSDQSFLLKYFP
jgi:hypothetical protein